MNEVSTGGSPSLPGLRVLDLSELLPWRYATSLLAELGQRADALSDGLASTTRTQN